MQWGRFGSLVEIAKVGLGGKGDEEGLREVTGFVCQVSLVVAGLFLETIIMKKGRLTFFSRFRLLIYTRPSPTRCRHSSQIYSCRPLPPPQPPPPPLHRSNQLKERPLPLE